MPVSQSLFQDPPVLHRNELEVLYAKRSDFARQLEILTNRRGQLADQVARTDATLRTAPQARLAELDAQISHIEKSARETDGRITALLDRGVTVHEPPVPSPPPPGPVIEMPVMPDGFIHIPSTGWADRDVMKVAGLEAAAFLVLTALLCRWTWQRAKARFSARPLADNNAQLQQAVDAIAIEVERISEGQRFVTTLLNKRDVDPRDARANLMPPAAQRPRTITPV